MLKMTDNELQQLIGHLNHLKNPDTDLRDRLIRKRVTRIFQAGKITEAQLWEFCSGSHGIPGNVASLIYQDCGFIPFSGYQLKKRLYFRE
jgi:hypothetical protein